MTPEQFEAALRALNWSNMHLASLLMCDEKLVRRWVGGEAAIPWSVGEWLVDLAIYFEDHPPPDNWRVR